ncbi:MAG: hypothetical protein ACRDL1_01275 [Solirubrobacterales bacterium]
MGSSASSGPGGGEALAALKPGERVLDLGSGSGMDVVFAALQVGEDGGVVGAVS